MKIPLSLSALSILLLWVAPFVYAQGAGHEWEALNKDAQDLRQQGEYKRAVVVLRKALALAEQEAGPDHPDVATSLYCLASIYQAQGDYTKAEPLSKRALAIFEKALGPQDPLVAMSLNNLAELYRVQGEYAKAEPLFIRSLPILEKALGPEDPRVAMSLNNLAELYRAQGDYGKAEPLHQRSLAIREKALGPGHPDVATSLYFLALLYLDTYDAKAEPLFKRSLAILEKAHGSDHPYVAVSLEGLAKLYRTTNRKAEAEKLEQRAAKIRAIELDPDLTMAHTNLGVALRQQGKLDEAIATYRRAIELDPDDAEAHYNLGAILLQQGKPDEAIESSRRAIELDPDLTIAHYNLGVALFQQDKLDEAIESFRRAIELDPDDAEAHYNLGLTLFQQDKLDEAISFYHRVIELDPEHSQVIANLVEAHAKLGQADRCGISIARFALAKKITADEASLVKLIEDSFRRLKVEVPVEKPTDQAVRDYYEANQESFTASAVHLHTLSLPKGKSTRAFADELRGKLVAGDATDFAAAAKQHSDDLAAEDGGDRGWVKRGDLRADLIDAAFALKAGEISAVIEDDSHYRILNTVEHRGGTPPPLEEVREPIVAKLIEEAQAKRISGWIEQARKEHAEAMDGA